MCTAKGKSVGTTHPPTLRRKALSVPGVLVAFSMAMLLPPIAMEVEDIRQPTSQMVTVCMMSLPQRGSHCSEGAEGGVGSSD